MPVNENPVYNSEYNDDNEIDYEAECQQLMIPINIFAGVGLVRYLPNDSEMKARYISFLMSKVDQANEIIDKIIDNPRSLTAFMYAHATERVKQDFMQMLLSLE